LGAKESKQEDEKKEEAEVELDRKESLTQKDNFEMRRSSTLDMLQGVLQENKLATSVSAEKIPEKQLRLKVIDFIKSE